MTERADQLSHDNAPAYSAAVVQTFMAKLPLPLPPGDNPIAVNKYYYYY
jgi:hypothetical protein